MLVRSNNKTSIWNLKEELMKWLESSGFSKSKNNQKIFLDIILNSVNAKEVLYMELIPGKENIPAKILLKTPKYNLVYQLKKDKDLYFEKWVITKENINTKTLIINNQIKHWKYADDNTQAACNNGKVYGNVPSRKIDKISTLVDKLKKLD